MLRLNLAVFLLSVAGTSAFAPHARTSLAENTRLAKPCTESLLTLFAEESKKKVGLDGKMRSKLLSETIAPWRSLRLFLYGSLGSGAFIGGLINGSGAIAASASPEFNLNTELLNLGIDFGAVALFAVLFKYDLAQGSELETQVEEKSERKKEMKEVSKGMKEREKILSKLPLEITVSSDGQTRESTVGELQAGAKQHMIVVAGPRKACRDALVGANLLKMDFAMSNVLVVPYETEAEKESRPSGGFAERPLYETQAYIARPTGEGWDDYIKAEMTDAVKQGGGGGKANIEGIAIVVANNGKVIRRGVGIVPWRQMVEQLEEEINPTGGPLPWI